MEIHANFYFKHPEKEKHELLVELLAIGDLNSPERISDTGERTKKMIEIAEQINPNIGKKLVTNLLCVFDDQESFGSESMKEVSNYCVSHWVNSSIGLEVQECLMHFFYKLCPDIHAQSWACGDDEPVEGWYKHENGQVYLCSDTACSEKDNIIFGTIYKWWHSTMPNTIKEGFLNDTETYQEACEEIYGRSFLTQPNISENTYNEWLKDKSNRSVVEYIEEKKSLSNNTFTENKTPDNDVANAKGKERKTAPISNESEHSELKDKLNSKTILQLIIFVVSLAWLIWVYLIK